MENHAKAAFVPRSRPKDTLSGAVQLEEVDNKELRGPETAGEKAMDALVELTTAHSADWTRPASVALPPKGHAPAHLKPLRCAVPMTVACLQVHIRDAQQVHSQNLLHLARC